MKELYKNDSDLFYKKYILNYKRALKMKMLGFKEVCNGYYYPNNNGKKEMKFMFYIGIISQNKYSTLAPTYEQCFDFFREKYDIIANIEKVNGFYRGYYFTSNEKNQEFIDYKEYELLKIIMFDSIVDFCLNRNRNNLT